MSKIKIDLHDVYNKSGEIDFELKKAIEDALEKRIPLVEIIHGKGSGQLKKRVLRFLESSEIKKLYFRIEKDQSNSGRIFVHFRHKNDNAYHG
jgi:dsDNA-specific endonuclease/ATPase MutS2